MTDIKTLEDWQAKREEYHRQLFEMLGLDFEQAKKEGSWLVLAAHEIGPPGQRQTVRTETLKAICEYCQNPANGVWIDTVETIGRYIRNQRKISR